MIGTIVGELGEPEVLAGGGTRCFRSRTPPEVSRAAAALKDGVFEASLEIDGVRRTFAESQDPRWAPFLVADRETRNLAAGRWLDGGMARLLLLALFAAALGSTASSQQLETWTLSVDGVERTALVHLPRPRKSGAPSRASPPRSSSPSTATADGRRASPASSASTASGPRPSSPTPRGSRRPAASSTPRANGPGGRTAPETRGTGTSRSSTRCWNASSPRRWWTPIGFT